MSYLVSSIPPIEVFIRKEFLYDFQVDENENPLGKGEFESAHWISTKSIPNQALYFESLIHDYGALYDKLPLHAYVFETKIRLILLGIIDYLVSLKGLISPIVYF